MLASFPFVVIDFPNLEPQLMLLQALCLTIFNLIHTRKLAEQLEASFSL